MSTEEFLLEILKIVTVPLLSFILGVIVTLLSLRDPRIRKMEIFSKLFHFKSEKFRDLLKNDFNVTKLEIVDADGKKISKPYYITDGSHEFRAKATYTDGSTGYFKAYWLCWEKGNPRGTDVLGTLKRDVARISHSPRHIRYTELSCWVFAPSKVQSNSHIPHDSTGFRYED